MKYFLIIFLFIIVACSSNNVKKIYICGDHPCADKNEVENYFNNNISVEVFTISSDSKNLNNFDLVELNIEDKNLLKKTNEDLKNINKRKEIEFKKKIEERKKVAKLKIKKIEKNNKTENKLKKTKTTNKSKNSLNTKSKKQNIAYVMICKNIEECDIDEVTKLITSMNKNKSFPDISFNK